MYLYNSTVTGHCNVKHNLKCAPEGATVCLRVKCLQRLSLVAGMLYLDGGGMRLPLHNQNLKFEAMS
jgi:hypothetical protein